MIATRLSDDRVNETLNDAYDNLKPTGYYPEDSIACSNLVIVELLARLLEGQKAAHVMGFYDKRAKSVPEAAYLATLFPDDLPAKIVKALDLASDLLQTTITANPKIGRDLLAFDYLSQEIRNELADLQRTGSP